MTAFEITQLFLLVVNAGLIWKYVASTEQIKSAAISQAKSLSEQTQSAREQAKAVAMKLKALRGLCWCSALGRMNWRFSTGGTVLRST